MSIPITSWLRAFFALQERAMDGRGFVEVVGPDEEIIRWPRTLGIDVIAIAALVDPLVRTLPLRYGGRGIARRWRVCVDDLERHALVALHSEYGENQTFWHTLPAICVYLHSEHAPLPRPEIWDVLLAQLGEEVERRNVGPRGDGPFKHFDGVKTFDDLYNEQFKYLRELRGVDKLKPEPGMSYGETFIPRTTNGDVVELADYWGKQLASVKKVMGHDGVVTHWRAVLADVDQFARKGDPYQVYPKNNAFWRVLRGAAVHVAAADEAPTTTDLAIEALKDSLKALPGNLKAGVEAVASGAASAAQAGGEIVNRAAKGLLGGLGTYLLIGGAAVVGLVLLTRNERGGAQAKGA